MTPQSHDSAESAPVGPILEVRDLSVEFHRRTGPGQGHVLRAVDRVSFSLSKGRTLGLVGESGSGKSTLAKAIIRLAPVCSGDILVNGGSILGLSEADFMRVRRRIQMVFQDPYHSLNPRMTVSAMLDEPMRIHFPKRPAVERRARAVQLLEQVGLGEDALARYPHQFSGGQRQRIGIARAMAVEPDVLLCDEAVSALDVSVQAQIVNLLQDLQEKHGFAYLFIGHDLAVIEHISDEVMVMESGRVVEHASADALYQNPSHPYTRRLLNAVPVLSSLAE